LLLHTILVGDQRDTVSSVICLFESSTCFEQLCTHLQENSCSNTTSGIITLKTIEWSKITKIARTHRNFIVHKTLKLMINFIINFKVLINFIINFKVLINFIFNFKILINVIINFKILINFIINFKVLINFIINFKVLVNFIINFEVL